MGFPSVGLGVPSSQELSAVGAVVAGVVGWGVFCPGTRPPEIANVVLAAAPNGEGWCFCGPKGENPCPVVGCSGPGGAGFAENLGIEGLIPLAVVPGHWAAGCPGMALLAGCGGACFLGTLAICLVVVSCGAACSCWSVLALLGVPGSSSSDSRPCLLASFSSLGSCRCAVGGVLSEVLGGCVFGVSCCGGGVSVRVGVGVLLALL